MSLFSLFLWALIFFIILPEIRVTAQNNIPTTLEGPSEPKTRRFDPSLRRGSTDLPMNHPRLRRNVSGFFPEQISLALSSPSSMWVSWITGILSLLPLFFLFLPFSLILFDN